MGLGFTVWTRHARDLGVVWSENVYTLLIGLELPTAEGSVSLP